MPEPLSYHHRFEIRVYFEDTDTAGIVYYANYLKFAERARTEMMRAHGSNHADLMQQTGLVFAVRRCSVEYLAPAKLDDLIVVKTRIEAIGGAVLDLVQDIYKEETLLTALTVRLALLSNITGLSNPLGGTPRMSAEKGNMPRPARIPPQLRAGLKTIMGESV